MIKKVSFLVNVFFLCALSDISFAQEKCYSLTQCVSDTNNKTRAEIVPQTQLAKCEDYKAKAKAVKGLILAERNSLASASACKAALSFSENALAKQFARTENERKKRQSAENKLILVGGIAFASGVVLTIVSVFFAKSLI